MIARSLRWLHVHDFRIPAFVEDDGEAIWKSRCGTLLCLGVHLRNSPRKLDLQNRALIEERSDIYVHANLYTGLWNFSEHVGLDSNGPQVIGACCGFVDE